ncbi:MAG TPA: hypothetical protein VGI56_13895 [Galbitalea sp.]|jgi:hypothetical protein
MANAPTLTGYNDSNPCPRVLVNFTTVAAGTQFINVYRVSEGRQFQVRGGLNLFASGGVAFYDYECPFGTSVTYRAEQFNSGGASLGFTDATAITLAVTTSWIHQPLQPTLAVPVRILINSANQISRPSPGATTWTEGGTVGTTIGGQRRGITGMSLNIRMANTSDSSEFLGMFGSYIADFPSVLCIRTPPPLRIPRLLFAGVLDPQEVISGVNAILGFNMTIDEVRPPSPGLIIPALRREDIDIFFATRTARAAAYATRTARDIDYSKAGLAGP